MSISAADPSPPASQPPTDFDLDHSDFLIQLHRRNLVLKDPKKWAGIELVDCSEVYNILMQQLHHSFVSDPNYLLMFDVRSLKDYNESHVMLARRPALAQDSSFCLPMDAEIECRTHVVVYDSDTSTFDDKSKESAALAFAQYLWKNGSKNPIKVILGGYRKFSAIYPFLRTQKIIITSRELDDVKTYPIEIEQGFLYLGNRRQADAPYIQKDLKIKAHINCTMDADSFFTSDDVHTYLQVSVPDTFDESLLVHFNDVCNFLETQRNSGRTVLVYSDRGISRSVACVMAYLIHSKQMTLQDTWKHIRHCSETAMPNVGFLQQLAQWEQSTLNAHAH